MQPFSADMDKAVLVHALYYSKNYLSFSYSWLFDPSIVQLFFFTFLPWSLAA